MSQDVLLPSKGLNKNFTYIDLKNFTVDVQIENNGNIFATWNHSFYCVSHYKIVLSEENKIQSTLITDVPEKLQSRMDVNLSKIFNLIQNRTYSLKIYLESTDDYNIGIASIEKIFTFDNLNSKNETNDPYSTPTPTTTPTEEIKFSAGSFAIYVIVGCVFILLCCLMGCLAYYYKNQTKKENGKFERGH